MNLVLLLKIDIEFVKQEFEKKVNSSAFIFDINNKNLYLDWGKPISAQTDRNFCSYTLPSDYSDHGIYKYMNARRTFLASEFGGNSVTGVMGSTERLAYLDVRHVHVHKRRTVPSDPSRGFG